MVLAASGRLADAMGLVYWLRPTLYVQRHRPCGNRATAHAILVLANMTRTTPATSVQVPPYPVVVYPAHRTAARQRPSLFPVRQRRRLAGKSDSLTSSVRSSCAFGIAPDCLHRPRQVVDEGPFDELDDLSLPLTKPLGTGSPVSQRLEQVGFQPSISFSGRNGIDVERVISAKAVIAATVLP